MNKSVFTITWADNVTEAERLRVSRLWAATLREKRGVAECRMQTFRSPDGDRARVDGSNNRKVELGEGPCSVCGLLAPLVERGPRGALRIVLLEHYPEQLEDAYTPELGSYCRGSGEPPQEVEAAVVA